jgi:hypothetical protein
MNPGTRIGYDLPGEREMPTDVHRCNDSLRALGSAKQIAAQANSELGERVLEMSLMDQQALDLIQRPAVITAPLSRP